MNCVIWQFCNWEIEDQGSKAGFNYAITQLQDYPITNRLISSSPELF